MSKLRERFESWYKKEFGVVPDYCFPFNHKTGEYGSFDLQCRWKQWQAALKPVRELYARVMGDGSYTVDRFFVELAKLLEE